MIERPFFFIYFDATEWRLTIVMSTIYKFIVYIMRFLMAVDFVDDRKRGPAI